MYQTIARFAPAPNSASHEYVRKQSDQLHIAELHWCEVQATRYDVWSLVCMAPDSTCNGIRRLQGGWNTSGLTSTRKNQYDTRGTILAPRIEVTKLESGGSREVEA